MASDDKECGSFHTDRVLRTDPGFKPHFEEFAQSQAAFFAQYAASHKKLSELGAKFDAEITI
jgi:L-ascorbate peroxidase|eukprot:2101488-Prymnesium_polylepis.2